MDILAKITSFSSLACLPFGSGMKRWKQCNEEERGAQWVCVCCGSFLSLSDIVGQILNLVQLFMKGPLRRYKMRIQLSFHKKFFKNLLNSNCFY